jgi:Skp family chaperone for outer membrane proteins
MRSCARHITAIVLFTALAAAPAAAQFKSKLPKIGPIGGKTPAAAAQTAPRSPTYNERVIEITDARIAGLLAGYNAELAALDAADKKQGSTRTAYEEENKKHPARLKEYEARHKTWQECQDTHVKPAEAKAKKEAEAAQAQVTGGDEADFERRMNAVAERIEAAQAKGDMSEVMRLSDSLSKSVGMTSAAAAGKASSDMQAAASKCGVEPVRPEPPTPPSHPDLKLDEAGAGAAKMTPEQYAIMKERVRYAVREEGKVEVTSSMWAFSGDELQAMEKRGPELYQAGQALQDRGY